MDLSAPQTPAGDLPLQNCEPVESRLRKQVQGCWRALLKDCKEKDLARLGTIAAPDFLGACGHPITQLAEASRQAQPTLGWRQGHGR